MAMADLDCTKALPRMNEGRREHGTSSQLYLGEIGKELAWTNAITQPLACLV